MAGSGIGSGSSGGAATALSWRQPAPGLPPLLLVGTAQAGAQIWFYQQQLMRWELAATLGSVQVRCWAAGSCVGARPPSYQHLTTHPFTTGLLVSQCAVRGVLRIY